jgi:AraC-like DNA-binding protein
MTFDLNEARAVLERTPAALDQMLRGLPEVWLTCTEGPDPWSPRDVVAHLAELEDQDWMGRVRTIVEFGETRPFTPIQRDAFLENPGRIRALARGLGTTARTLERRVLDATGLSPRALRAVLRFRRVFRRLDRSPAGSWARVAVESGYYDQAHMIREFRRFAGVAPGRFFGREASLAVAFAGGD